MLRRQILLASLVAALPAAAVLGYAVDRVRRADMELALERVVRSQINEQVRERCESDPTWFLTGPLEGRPAGGKFVETSPDQLPPRPRVVPQPFELFAYDEQFIGSSSASPRMPPEFRQALRSSSPVATGDYVTEDGTGVQVAMPTGWIGSMCMFFMGRMAPPPAQMRDRVITYAGGLALSWLVALAVAGPLVGRIRRVASQARAAVDAGYVAIAPDTSKDELGSLTFVYNDAATEIHERRARIDDQDAALRRFVVSTDEEVARPLVALGTTLAGAAQNFNHTRDDLYAALRQAHDLSARVENLTAAAKLRLVGREPAGVPFDLNAVVTRVIARHMPIADAGGVALHLSLPPKTVTIVGDETLIERAIANVVDNAIRYNRPDGDVRVTLATAEDGSRFRLCVTDNGDGVSDEEYRGLTAVRRFRGDEGRIRRPGAPGLGLAVAREVADRFALRLDLKRPSQGGFEAEFSGTI